MTKLFIIAALLCVVNASAKRNFLKNIDEAHQSMPERHKVINGLKLGQPVKVMDSFQTTAAQYLEMQNYGAAGCAGDPIQIASVATGICYQAEVYSYVDDDEYDISYYYSFYGGGYYYDYGYFYYHFDDEIDELSSPDLDHGHGNSKRNHDAKHHREAGGHRNADHHHNSKHASSSSSNRQLREHGEQERHEKHSRRPHQQQQHQPAAGGDAHTEGWVALRSVEYSVVSETVSGVTYFYLNTTGYYGDECTGKSWSYTTTLDNQCYDYPTYSDDLFDDAWYWYDYSYDDHALDGEREGQQKKKGKQVRRAQQQQNPEIFYDDDIYAYNYGGYGYNYGGYFYYDSQGHGLSMITTVSNSQFTTPSDAGVTTEYFFDSSDCVDAYYGIAETAPYTVWDAANACLTNAAWLSTSIDYCSDGIAYATEYYLSSDCNSRHTWSTESYSYCYYSYQNVQCTGTWPASNVPTMQPTNPHSAVVLFTVDQKLQNISKDDMDDSASVSAFTTAVYEALDSTYVTDVEVVSVSESPSASTNVFVNAFKRLLSAFSSSSTSNSCEVSYSVTFSCLTIDVSDCYYSLSTQLAYAVVGGDFETYLHDAAAKDPNCPANLLTCGAKTEPTVSGYTVLSTDDDYDDGNSNSKPGIPVGTVAGVAVAGAVLVAATITGWYFMRKSKAAKSGGYDSGQATTSTVGMETMNPTYAGGVPPQNQPYPQQMELGAMPAVTYSGASANAPPLPIIRPASSVVVEVVPVATPVSPAGPMQISAVDIGAHEVVGSPGGLHPV